MRLLLLKTLRDLRAAGAQTAALVVVSALGIASFVALVGAFEDLSTSYDHTYHELAFADVGFSIDGAPQSVVDAVAHTDGVTAVTGRLVVDAGLALPGDERVRARLIGVPADRHPAVDDVLVEHGRWLRTADGRAAVVERHFAQARSLTPGDRLSVLLGGRTVTLDVVGTGASPEYLVVVPSRHEFMPSPRTFAVLFVPLDALRGLVGAGPTVNDLAVRVAPAADRGAVIARIRSILAPYGVREVTTKEDQPSNAGLKLDLDGYREIAALMPGLILLAAGLSLYVLVGRLVLAQRPQIGLMKALGWNDRDVLLHYLAFALAIGVAGAVLGAAAGALLASGVTRDYAGELGIPLVETRFHPELVTIAAGLSVLVAALGGLGPARASARIDPALAMRLDPSTAAATGSTTAIERVVRLPLWVRLPLRNALRMRWRSLSTVVGMVLAAVLILATWSMADSMNYLLDHNFGTVERWDVQATFSEPQSPDVIERVRSQAGVRAAEGELLLPGTLRANGHTTDVLLTALAPAERLHLLETADGRDASSSIGGERIVLSATQMDKLGVAIGDRVTVETPLGKGDLIAGAAVSELSGSAAYVSLADAARIAGTASSPINAVLVSADPRRARDVEAALYRLPATASVKLKADEERDWRDLMGFFYVFIGVILAFAVAMAFAVLFNATTINVLERLRELATMRALGAGLGEVARLIAVEHVLLWAVAVIPGLILGTWVADQLGATFSSDLITLRIVVAPTTYLWAALGILVTTLAAALPGVRHVGQLDLAQATKVFG